MSACGGAAPRSRSSAIPACSSVPADADPEQLAAEIKSRPPVLLVHGDRDDLIPVEAMFQAAERARRRSSVPVEWHMSAGIGHGIDQEGLRHGGEFLARRGRRADIRAAAQQSAA